MGAVLVHIDLDGERPHASSIAALTAGRAIASSWGATLYAGIVAQDTADDRPAARSTAEILTTREVPGIAAIQRALARAGADKLVVALTDAPIAPLWSAVGVPWQGVLDHLRPRLVLFGADAPSAAELGPRTGARIGARLLLRARATRGDQVELRDRDGGHARASDGGAAVALIGTHPALPACEGEIDLSVLVFSGAADPRVELVGASPAEPTQTLGPVVAIGDDAAADTALAATAQHLARQLGATLVGGPAAVRAGAVVPAAVVDRYTALAPELCVAVGAIGLDLAGSTRVVRVGPASAKGVEGVLGASDLSDLTRALDEAGRG